MFGGIGGVISALAGTAGKWIGGKLGPKIPGLTASEGASGGHSVGSALGNWLSQGIDSPGARAGQFTKDYYEKLGNQFNQWDMARGGPGSSGQMAVAEQQVKTQKEMQEKDIEAKIKIAKMNNETAKEVAATQFGGANAPPIQGQIKQHELKRIKAEITRILASADTETSRAELARYEAKLAELFSYAKLYGTGGVGGTMAALLRRQFPKLAKRLLGPTALGVGAVGVGSAAAVGDGSAPINLDGPEDHTSQVPAWREYWKEKRAKEKKKATKKGSTHYKRPPTGSTHRKTTPNVIN